MLRAGGLELTSLINSDFPKGYRSATRRSKKATQSRRSLKRGSRKLVFVDSKGVDMSMRESDKHQESSLVVRSCDKIEHLPIKKRRFLSSSHTSSSRIPLPDQGEAAIVRSENVSVDNGVNIQCTNSKIEIEQADNGLFCGISLLAAAACSSSLKKKIDLAEDASVAEVLQPQGATSENFKNNEAGSLSNGLLEEEHLSFSEYPVEATPARISIESVGKPIPPVSEKAQAVREEDNSTCPGAGEDCLRATQDVYCSQDEAKISGRDDRLRLDLNVMVDDWEQSFDDPVHYTDVAADIIQEAAKTKYNEEIKVSNAHDLLGELQKEGSESHVMLMSSEPISSNESSDSNMEDQKVDVGCSFGQPISVFEKYVSDECNNKVDLAEAIVECKSADQKVDIGSIVEQPNSLSEKSVSDECKDKMDLVETILECKSADCQEPDDLCAPVSEQACSLMLDFLNKEVANVSSVSEVQEGVPRLSSDTAEIELHQNLDNDGNGNATRSLRSDDKVIVERIDLGMNVIEDDEIGLGTVRKNVALFQGAHVNCQEVETSQDMQANEISVLKEGVMDTYVGKDVELGIKNNVPSDGDDFCLASAEKEAPNHLSTRCRLRLALATRNNVSLDNENTTDVEALSLSNVKEPTVNQAAIPGTSISVCNYACETNSSKYIIPCDSIALEEPECNKGGSYVSCSLSLEGHESQYEDSELRESAELVIKECDGLNQKHKHVDYGSYNQEYRVCISDNGGTEPGQTEDLKECRENAADRISYVRGKTKDEHNIQHANLTVHQRDLDEEGYLANLNPSTDDKMGASGLDELHDGNKISSDATSRARGKGDENDRISDGVDDFVDSETAEVRLGLQASSKETQSCAARPADDIPFREGRHDNVGSRFRVGDGVIRRCGREPSSLGSSDRFRYPLNSCPRARRFDSWEGSAKNRGIKGHCIPAYHRYRAAYEDDGDDGSYVASTLTRKLDLGMAGGRARFIRYNEVDNRAVRGRYNGPTPKDSLQPSLKFKPPWPQWERSPPSPIGRHPWSRRERSPSPIARHPSSRRDRSPSPIGKHPWPQTERGPTIKRHPWCWRERSPPIERHPWSRRERSPSPNERRAYTLAHQSHETSSSRPRFHSPNTGLSPRARFKCGNAADLDFRQHSGSPNFGSDGRMMRQPVYVADHKVRHRSFSRSKGSTPFPPSYLDQRDKGSSDSVELGYEQRLLILDRSPGRDRLRDDVIYTYRNMKTNGYLRSTQNPRFFDMDGAGREIECEVDDGRRKQNVPIHLARDSYPKGTERRLYHDDDDSERFAPGSREPDEITSRIRGIEARMVCDIAKCFGEDHQQFSSNIDIFGDDGMESSRNLKSNEHYKSVHRAKFVDFDGRGGRVHGYEDYNGRKVFTKIQQRITDDDSWCGE